MPAKTLVDIKIATKTVQLGQPSQELQAMIIESALATTGSKSRADWFARIKPIRINITIPVERRIGFGNSCFDDDRFLFGDSNLIRMLDRQVDQRMNVGSNGSVLSTLRFDDVRVPPRIDQADCLALLFGRCTIERLIDVVHIEFGLTEYTKTIYRKKRCEQNGESELPNDCHFGSGGYQAGNGLWLCEMHRRVVDCSI